MNNSGSHEWRNARAVDRKKRCRLMIMMDIDLEEPRVSHEKLKQRIKIEQDGRTQPFHCILWVFPHGQVGWFALA